MRFTICILWLVSVLELAAASTFSPSTTVRGINRDIYIAARTDGRAGTGTSDDPFDGSTTAKFDAAFAAAVTSSARIHLGPGTFTTSGQIPGQVRFGLTGGSFILRGAGVGVTTVKLANGAGTNTNGYMSVIGQHSSDIGTGQTPEYLEIGHLTIDCNRSNQPIVTGNQNGVIGAVGVGARRIYLHDLHAKNSYGKGLEAFVVVAASPAVPDARAVIERVTVTDMTGPSTAINANGTSLTNCIRGIVRDCSVIGDGSTSSGVGQIGYGGWLFDGFQFHNNRFAAGVAGFICDSFSNTNLVISGNEVHGPYGWGIIANSSAANYTGLYVRDNWFGYTGVGGGKAIELASPEPAIDMRGNVILCAVVGTTNLVTPSEIGYLKGLTNNVQTQINALLTGGAGFDWNITNGNVYGGLTFYGSDLEWRINTQDSPNSLQVLYDGDGVTFYPTKIRPNDSESPFDIGDTNFRFRDGFFTNIWALNKGYVVTQSVVVITNQYTFSGNVLGLSTNAAGGLGYPIITNAFRPMFSTNKLRVYFQSVVSRDSLGTLGWMLTDGSTNYWQEHAFTIPGNGYVVPATRTAQGIPIVSTSSNINFYVSLWQESAGNGAAGRSTASANAFNKTVLVIQEYVP